MAAANFGFTTGASATPDTTAPAIVSRTPDQQLGRRRRHVAADDHDERTNHRRSRRPELGAGLCRAAGVGTFQLAGQYTVDSTGTVITFAVTGGFPANATIQWYTNYNNTIRDMAGLLLPNQFAHVHDGERTGYDRPDRPERHADERRDRCRTVRDRHVDVLGVGQPDIRSRQHGRAVCRPDAAVAEHYAVDRQPHGLPVDDAAARPRRSPSSPRAASPTCRATR